MHVFFICQSSYPTNWEACKSSSSTKCWSFCFCPSDFRQDRLTLVSPTHSLHPLPALTAEQPHQLRVPGVSRQSICHASLSSILQQITANTEGETKSPEEDEEAVSPKQRLFPVCSSALYYVSHNCADVGFFFCTHLFHTGHVSTGLYKQMVN